jgi:hypothetical protein
MIKDATEAVIDREQLFVLFATFCGDAERTAHAAGLRAVDVLRVADDEGWLDRLKPIIELKKSNRPGDIERAINRALNFSQAHRMRLIVERVLHKIAGFTDEQLAEYMFTKVNPKTGEAYDKLETRPLADLASAMEKAQAMSYQALSDTVQDRTRRKETSESESAAGDMMVKIADAMGQVRASNTPRAMLTDAQLKVAENNRLEAFKGAPPKEDDTFEGEQH